jgi:uncharacterized protein YcgL (UPF0745 family)
MKDQYFGDINDYRKYGLLRVITKSSRLRLLVAWMLTRNDGSTDGKFVSYIAEPSKWQGFDPELFWRLKDLLGSGSRREVGMIERSELLGNAGYFSGRVPDQIARREQWFGSLQAHTEAYDLVFLDPDNGLEVKSTPPGTRNSAKFLYWSEVKALWGLRKSLLIYQHFIRQNRHIFIQRMLDSLASATPGSLVTAFATPNVAFLMALQPEHQHYQAQIVQSVQEGWEDQINHWGRAACSAAGR